MNYILIMRGLPGSGKTTLAKTMTGYVRCSADDFFMVEGEYRFDRNLLPEAHKTCRQNVEEALKAGLNVIVDNTNVRLWQMQDYIDVARRYKATIAYVDLFDGGCTDEELASRNVHGVPVENIETMRKYWEELGS
jgi:predicted kinase